MNSSQTWLVALMAAAAAFLYFSFQPSPQASAQRPIVLPSGDEVRFELLGNEPIAGPDGRALVSDWSVLVFRDRRVDRCYVAFKHGDAIAVETTECAPRQP